jgi:urea transport system ATP-binding protein
LARSAIISVETSRSKLGLVLVAMRDAESRTRFLGFGMLLAQEPKLLLVDEPAAGMTDQETADTADLLREIAETRSVVVVEHDFCARPRRQGDRPARRLGPRRRLPRCGQRQRARGRSLSRAVNMLSVENLSLHYGAAQALRRVSIEAKPGEVTCVLGRNGVGKTSLLRAIVGQRAISGGTIRFDGRDIGGMRPYTRAGLGIAYVPQGREIFPLLTVRENLETGYAPLRAKHRSIPDEVFELFPVLKTMLHRRGGDLSGGQQQQLAIGRALVTRPKLLVLDEPTEGIQPSIIKDIGRAIAYLRGKGGMSILLVEQYFEFARDLADRFVVMERGEVVEAGDRAALAGDRVRERLAI